MTVHQHTTAWDKYWQAHNTANSFALDYTATQGPYGVVNRYWRGVFEQFDRKTILDLGAGNGALAGLYLHQYPAFPCLQWHSTDIADTQPTLSHARLSFSREDMHNLSFATNSIDHVVSMFGLEYSDAQLSVSELQRVLKLGGQFDVLLHHHDAVITRQSKLSIEAFNAFISLPLFTDEVGLGGLSYSDLRQVLLESLTQLLHKVPPNQQDDIKLIGQNIYSIIQLETNVKSCVKKLMDLRQSLHWQLQRLQQQVAAANNYPKIIEQLTQSGLTYMSQPLTHGDNVLGWALSGRK